jgi:hypothetical protein
MRCAVALTKAAHPTQPVDCCNLDQGGTSSIAREMGDKPEQKSASNTGYEIFGSPDQGSTSYTARGLL